MFRRKEDGTEDLLNTTTAEDTSGTTEASAAPTMPTSAVPAFATSSGAANYRAATTATPTSTTPTTPTSSTGGSNVTDITRGRFEARPTPANASSETSKPAGKSASNRVLTVGNDILLKGEITTCDRLVIEGAVDATLKDVHTMEITETGSFKGIAQVQEAEISGTVEGDLNVTGRLIIYSTGKVSGNVTYGEIEIERGGKLSGEIKTQGKTEAAKKAA